MGAKVQRAAKTAERGYVPFEDDPTAAAKESAKPSMQEVFGPGGFLEKCMLAGFDRAAVGSDYEYRPAQLEMAEIVHDAFETRHHAIVEAGRSQGVLVLRPAAYLNLRHRL